MKRCGTLIAIGICALVAACDDSRGGAGLLTGPTPDVGGLTRGHSLDLLLSNGLYVGYPTAPQETRVTAQVEAGSQYEIRIHSYYGSAPFELSAEWHSAP